MFTSSALPVFILAALGLLIVPGPAVIYIVTRSAAQGRKAGLASVLGIELASLCHSLAAALGLSAILLASTVVFDVVKYAGAAYLAYLGIRTLMRNSDLPAADNEIPISYAYFLRRGFIVNLLNPKTALFFYAFLPQFVNPARGSPVGQILSLGALFICLATCTDSAYALAASGIGRLLTEKTALRKAMKYVTGGIYLALGIAAAIAGAGKSNT